MITQNDGPDVLECNVDPYDEPGAGADDVCEGSVDVSIGGDVVDTGTVGTYNVTYDAADVCSNTAVQSVRTVEVVDTTPPDVFAELVPSSPSCDDDSDSGDDCSSDDSSSGPAALVVSYGATDLCDQDVDCTAVIVAECLADDDSDSDSDSDSGQPFVLVVSR